MASRYFVAGGVDNNWGTTGNWATSSGGAGGAGVPTSADDVFFDASSPNCTVDAAARAAKTLTCTGYTNTLTLTQNLAVSGSVTLAAGMGLGGAGLLRVIATATVTFNGRTVPRLELSGNSTITLGDTGTVTTKLMLGFGFNTLTVNSNGLSLGGDLEHDGTSTISGTSTLTITGTGSWTTLTSASGGAVRLNVTINTGGTVTFLNSINFSATLTHTTGTVVTTGSTFNCGLAATTFNTGTGITFNNLTLTGNFTHVLQSDVYVSGLLLTATGIVNTVINGAFTFYVSGSLRSGNAPFATTSGTAAMVLNGTGTWDMPGATGGSLRNNLTINTSGTITISGTVAYGTGTLTYVAGTVVTTGSTLSSTFGATFNVNGITWNNLSLSGGVTFSFPSHMQVAGLATLGSGLAGTTLSGSQLQISGSFRFAAANGQVPGTTTILLNGTGTWDCDPAVVSGSLRNSVTIDTAGTITLSGQLFYQTGTLTYTGGTVLAYDSTLWITNSTTIVVNAAGLELGWVSVLSGTLTCSGTNGCALRGLWLHGTTCTFKAGLTYPIRKALVACPLTLNSTSTLNSGTASSAATVVYQGLTVLACFLNVTDIDSSGGKACQTVAGTLTRTTNWTSVTSLEKPVWGPAPVDTAWSEA